MVDLFVKTLRIISGAIISIIVYLINKPTEHTDVLLTILIGLSTSILVSLLINDFYNSKSLKQHQKIFSEVLSIQSNKNEIQELQNLLLKYGFLEISVDKFPIVWLEILWKMKQSYHTTLLTTPDELGLSHNNNGLNILKTKVSILNCDVKRVFIIKDKKEQSALRRQILNQKHQGITVKYITYQEIKDNHILKPYLKQIESIDFSIIDKKVILITTINKRHNISKFKLCTDKEVIANYERFYEILFQESKDLVV